MTATFQKTIDKTLDRISSKFAFLDDILEITKGNIQKHELELDKNNEKIRHGRPSNKPPDKRIRQKHNRKVGIYNNSHGKKPLYLKTQSHNEIG